MIKLQSTEKALRDTITEKLKLSNQKDSWPTASEESHKLFVEAGQAAHKLHLHLKELGHEPKHHAYMIRNRGVQPDHPDFYMQVHAIQDLLSFLQNPKANDDPLDSTIGAEFEFIVYSKRWGHDDTYRVTRTEDGWEVHHKSIGGSCDAGGHPYLYRNFDQDYISYPSKLDGRLEWLWDQARIQGFSYDDVQHGLQELADWVSETEKSTPSEGVWRGY